MEEELSKDKILRLVELEDDEFSIEQMRKKHNIDPESSVFHTSISRFVNEDGALKRLRRGWVRKVKQVEPIKWWDGEEKERLDIVWPSSHGDDEYTLFGFEDTIEIYPGDSILVAGDSNWGKSALAQNLLVDNFHLFAGARLMVNEYKPLRFRKRMRRFDWVDFWDGEKPKFETLPITENHVDYIKPNYLNVIDWIHIKGDFWDIATIIQDIQMQLRDGIAIIVIQKTGGKEMGVGGDWGKFFPAVYLTLDPPGKLTLVKVKSYPEGARNPEGKMYGFDIIEGGSRFHNIREVVKCSTCWGKKWKKAGNTSIPCDNCGKKGYVDK